MPDKTALPIEDKVLRVLNLTGKGLIINNLPLIARGMITEVLRQYNISLDDVIDMVNKNEILWERISTKDYAKIQNVVVRLGTDVDWFTADYFIDAIRRRYPAIASLFLSDKRSLDWLKLQIAVAKRNIGELQAGGKYAAGTIPANNPGYRGPGV